jgi:intracellular septation protein A
MDPTSALFGILPLVVFAVIDLFAGMRAAIVAAMIVALLEAGWSWYSFGEIDQLTWISIGLIFVMGGLSIWMKDSRLFKFQPVVLAGVMALVFSWYQWVGEPILVQFMPKFASLLSAEQQALLNDERMIKSMARLDLMMIGVFLIHGVMVAWSALRKSTLHWLIVRGVGIYALMLIAVLLNGILLAQS